MLNFDNLLEVTSEKLFTREGTIDEDGLLSQRIFGPINKHMCLCGNYASKVLYDNQKCPKCNVLCADSRLRDVTFAKLTLPYPFYKSSDLKRLTKLTGKRYEFVFNPVLRDMATSMELYLTLNTTNDTLKLTESFSQNSKQSSMITIPFAITGSFSLYITLKVAERMGSRLAGKYANHFKFSIPIVPPNSRPTTAVSTSEGKSKSKYVHELDTLYINLLHKRNFLTAQSMLNVDIDDIVDTVSAASFNISPIIIDDIILYELEQSKIQYYVNKLYETVQITLSGKEGLIRHDFLGKIIDFSARAVISPNPSLQPYEIKIPIWIFIKLWFIEYLWYLAEIEGIEINNIKEIMRNADGIKKETNSIHEFINYFFNNSVRHNRIMFINRQPTLWRYGMPSVEVIGISDGDTIETSPIFLDPLNGDYDGDTMALYRIHDRAAVAEMEQTSFILNTIKYDHSSDYLHTIKDETYFYLKIFSDTVTAGKVIDGEYSLADVDITERNIIVYDHEIVIDGNTITMGLALLNVSADFSKITIKPGVSRQELSRLIFRDSASNEQYFERLTRMSNFLNCAGLLIGSQAITLPVKECNDVVNQAKTYTILDKLPNHPVIGYMIYKATTANILRNIPKSSQMHKLRKTKFGETQFARSLICTGYVSDHENITSGTAIRNSTFGGLSEDEFFKTSYGARKGITDKDKVVPESGYLERSMVMNFSPVEICEDDCGTTYGFPIRIANRNHAKSLIGRYYTSAGSDVWTKLDPDQAKDLISQEIMVRSPITCISHHHKICRKCFGDSDVASPFVGLITGQYLAERTTQLVLRVFHTSGSATYNYSDKLHMFMVNNIEDINHHDNHDSKYFTITLKSDIPKELLSELKSITYDTFIESKSSATYLSFYELNECENDDVSTVMNAVKSQMTASDKLGPTAVQDSYDILMHNFLSLGFIKSIFVEIALCNMFINEDDVVFRYGIRKAQEEGLPVPALKKRLNIKGIHKYVSPLLSLLYEPNAKSINDIDDLKRIGVDLPPEKLSIFERIWIGSL